ncbi:MAG TPA: hypothetical protein VIH89_19025 [Candidatus Sulfotelmatobacter sp.]
MFISRLVVLSLLTAVCVAPVAAQSLLSSDSAGLQPELTFPADSLDRIHVDQFRLPVTPLLSSPSADPVHTSMGPVHRFLQQNAQSEDQSTFCYSMRSYRVVRDDPESDSTRLAGYSTCQRSGRFQVKTVEGSLELLTR